MKSSVEPGCSVPSGRRARGARPGGSRARDGARAVGVTFTKDVLRYFRIPARRATARGPSPMSLMTYEETRPGRAHPREGGTRTMPPWYIDKNIGVQGFKYDRSLTTSGSPPSPLGRRRRAARQPGRRAAGREFADRDQWQSASPLDRPDPSPRGSGEGATGGATSMPIGLTEDVWISAVETKPSSEGSRSCTTRSPVCRRRRMTTRATPQRVRPGQERRHLPPGPGAS